MRLGKPWGSLQLTQDEEERQWPDPTDLGSQLNDADR